MNESQTFFSMSLQGHFNNLLKQDAEDIQGLDDVAELEAYEARDVKVVEPIRLRRDEAKFDRVLTAGGNSVTVQVPFYGPLQMVNYQATDGTRGSMTGVTQGSSGRWRLDDEAAPTHWIGFQKVFVDESADEVRLWAAPLVDELERRLGEQESQIGGFNDQRRRTRTALLEARRATLTAGAKLDEDLGQGI